MKLDNKCIVMYIMVIIMACISGLLSAGASVSEIPGIEEIYDKEFYEVYSQRELYECRVDTIGVSTRACRAVRAEMMERLDRMDDSDTWMYDRDMLGAGKYEVLGFPSGLIAVCVMCPFDESEYWFFRERDYRFVAGTGTLSDINGVRHCVSNDGYMVTWQNHAYDSNVDISIYQLHEGDVRPVARWDNVGISVWEQACFGPGNAFYVKGEYMGDEKPRKMCLRFIPSAIKL